MSQSSDRESAKLGTRNEAENEKQRKRKESNPIYFNGQKIACANCIRGHRSSYCDHDNKRAMWFVNAPGRPRGSCNHPRCNVPGCSGKDMNHPTNCCEHVNCARELGHILAKPAPIQETQPSSVSTKSHQQTSSMAPFAHRHTQPADSSKTPRTARTGDDEDGVRSVSFLIETEFNNIPCGYQTVRQGVNDAFPEGKLVDGRRRRFSVPAYPMESGKSIPDQDNTSSAHASSSVVPERDETSDEQFLGLAPFFGTDGLNIDQGLYETINPTTGVALLKDPTQSSSELPTKYHDPMLPALYPTDGSAEASDMILSSSSSRRTPPLQPFNPFADSKRHQADNNTGNYSEYLPQDHFEFEYLSRWEDWDPEDEENLEA